MNLFDMFGGFQKFQQDFSMFAQNFGQQTRMTPQEKVQQLLDTGQMSQEQFNRFSQIANAITGTKKF